MSTLITVLGGEREVRLSMIPEYFRNVLAWKLNVEAILQCLLHDTGVIDDTIFSFKNNGQDTR